MKEVFLNKYEQIKKQVERTISSVDFKEVQEFVNIIMAHKYNKIVGVGAGRVGYSLRGFIMRLGHLGFNATFIGDTTVPHLQKDDLMIVASGSGKTQTIAYYAKIAKTVQQCKVISITGDKDSPIANLSDHAIIMDARTSQLIMTTLNELSLHFLFDIMVEFILDTKNYDRKGVKNNHSRLE